MWRGPVSEQETSEAQPEGLPMARLSKRRVGHLDVAVPGVLEGGTTFPVLLPCAPIRAVDVTVVLTDDPLPAPQEVTRGQPPAVVTADGDVELRLGSPHDQ